MPDWFDDHAPDAGLTAPAPRSWWDRVKATHLSDLPHAFMEDLPGIAQAAITPVARPATHAAQLVSDWLGELEHGGGGPERSLVEGAGRFLDESFLTPLAAATMVAGPAARLGVKALTGGASRTAEAALLPMLNGDRQFTMRGGPSAWDSEAARLQREYAAINAEPAGAIRTANDIAAEQPYMRPTSGGRASYEMPADTGDPLFPTPRESYNIPGLTEAPWRAPHAPVDMPADTGGTWTAPAPRSASDIIAENLFGRTPSRSPHAPVEMPADTGGPWSEFSAMPSRQPVLPEVEAPAVSSWTDLLQPEAERLGAARTGALSRAEAAAPDWFTMHAAPETPSSALAESRTIEPSFPQLSPRSPVHPIRELYDELRPQWEASDRATADVPFSVEPESFPEFYQRVLTDDPRVLMGKERAVRSVIDRAMRSMGDETGAIDPGVAAQATGQMLRAAPRALDAYRRSALVSGPSTWGVNILGDVAGPHLRALEDLIAGNPHQAGRILREFWSPQTVTALKEGFQAPASAGSKFGPSAPGIGGWRDTLRRIMEAPDVAARDALERAGLSSLEANKAVWRGNPLSTTGANVTRVVEDTPLLRAAAPFPRFGMNFLEANLQRTPGIGLLPWVQDVARKEGATVAERLARQATGTAATVGGYALAKHEAPARHAHQPTISGQRGLGSRLAMAALASTSLPASLGMAYELRHEMPAKTGNLVDRIVGELDPQAKGSAAETLLRAIPLLSDTYPGPKSYLASLVPGFVRDFSPVDPALLDPSHPRDPRIPSALGPAIAKIPFLNDLLLYRRTHPNPSPTLGSTVTDWFEAHGLDR